MTRQLSLDLPKWWGLVRVPADQTLKLLLAARVGHRVPSHSYFERKVSLPKMMLIAAFCELITVMENAVRGRPCEFSQ